MTEQELIGILRAQRIVMKGVREYCEEMDVALSRTTEGRLVIEARNEGGYNCTQVDLEDLLDWLRKNCAVLSEYAVRPSQEMKDA